MQNMYDEKGVKMNKLLKYTFMLLCCFLLMGCLPLDKETDKKSIVCTTYAPVSYTHLHLFQHFIIHLF